MRQVNCSRLHELMRPSCCVAAHSCWGRYMTGRSTCAGHEQSVEAIKVCSHLAVIASVGLDGKLLLWDAARHNLRASCSHTEVSPILCTFLCS